jgi:hypothetical protein
MRGKSRAVDINENINRSLNFNDSDWEDLTSFIGETVYQELGAHLVEGALGNPLYKTKSMIFDRLNNDYLIPKFKFATSETSFEKVYNEFVRIQNSLQREEITTETGLREFNNFIQNNLGQGIKKAVLFKMTN